MQEDIATLENVEQNTNASPTFRFFRFKSPTLSYGRLQKRDQVQSLLPDGWDLVQRPTGGGIVFHKDDLCFSLCWKDGQFPLPSKPQEQYRWIHSVVLEALAPSQRARMACCEDVTDSAQAFQVRTCFQNPVGYDLLNDQTKILGGALRCTRRATLYQGSLQIPQAYALQAQLHAAFKKRLLNG